MFDLQKAKELAYGPVAAPHSVMANTLADAVKEIERMRIENIQLKFACGYPMPAELEKHIIPSNPFQCGICDARNRSN